MDDLLGEDWQAPKKSTTTNPSVALNPSTFASQYSSFRNSPTIPSSATSARSTPQPRSAATTGTKPPSGDSFGNLFSSKIQKQTTNVSIQERQRQIEEERRKQQDEQSRLWNDLGSGRGTPEIRGTSLAPITRPTDEDENDILAAFNKAAPVNKATYFPPPDSGPVSRGSTPALSQVTPSLTVNDNDDDDPFGLGSLPQRPSNHLPSRPLQRTNDDDDDDILGDLGRPMIERDPSVAPSFSDPEDDAPELPQGDAALDREVAELVDMGFPADNARIALAESGGGVQGAVSWLLQQAHEESRAKSRGEGIERQRSPNGRMSPPRRRREEEPSPSWMRQDGRSSSTPRRQNSRSPAGHEKDVSQVAQEFGSKFLKGANSLWKASQKQMAKTMSEFQQEREPNQPKWMQESSGSSSRSNSRRPPEARVDDEVTNEAALLDMPRERSAKPPRQPAPQHVTEQPALSRRPDESTSQRLSPQPRFMQQTPPVQDKRPTTKLSRQDVEEQSAQAYVSPARRRRPTPKPETAPEPEVDLFSPAPPQAPPTSIRTNGASTNQGRASPAPRPSPAPSKPKAPPRNIPSVSPSALATSANHRKVGGEAFKRGDYASAHESYTAALSPLPPTHPVLIIVLSNRALTALKTGDAKTAVSDADQALTLIGASQGVGETIDLGGGGGGAEGPKDMREFYGKALMRKAEALEHLEKWADAAAVWRQAVEAGVGGAVSLRGRDRCERTAAPKPPPAAKPPPARTPAAAKGPSKPTPRPALSSAASAEAVKKLRAANAAADKADDERFQLADQVDAKLSAWKGGKADNLRALLQSLDAVLWPAAGWKKVGMSDLVMPNKVKIVYMKAIAKVHPDKISQDATTEEKMISAAVFSTLNEAWDKFKKDNNL